MSILDRVEDLFFSGVQLTGARWNEPGRHSFDSRVAAVAEHGCAGLGITVADLKGLLAERSAESLREMLAAHDVRVHELELLFGWNLEGEMQAQAREMEESLYPLAQAIGATNIKTTAVYPPGYDMPPVDVLVERFGALCDRAAEHGISIVVEPLGIMSAFDFEIAGAVISGADRPNGGLLIDVWHLFRSVKGMDALSALDGRHIVAVELCDALREPQGDLLEESDNGRLFPGEGEFPLIELMHLLTGKGANPTFSIEVLSADLRKLSPGENASLSVSAFRKFLDAWQAASVAQ